jgi:large subunit ribosomal protein L23
LAKDPYNIVLYPYVTEKTLRLIENENKLEFIVRKSSTKPEIVKAIEEIFEVKVEKIATKITKRGKHAIVKLRKEYSASDLGMRIGII